MTESSSKGIGRVFQRTVTRTKEKVLQNLGKADKTKDDEFEQHLSNFHEQLSAATKLQKELKHYTASLKTMSQASLSMYKTIKELYENEWIGYTEFCSAHEDLPMCWETYMSQLNDQVISPLNGYINLFPDYKVKIAKRSRKLTDFDSARHNHESVSNAKKLDDNKISKALEELSETKQVYETINAELHDDLPLFYNSRLNVMSTAFSNIIAADLAFFEDAAKVKNVMSEATRRLKDDSSGLVYRPVPNLTGTLSMKMAATSPSPASISEGYANLEFKLTTEKLVPAPKLHSGLRNQTSNNDASQSTSAVTDATVSLPSPASPSISDDSSSVDKMEVLVSSPQAVSLSPPSPGDAGGGKPAHSRSVNTPAVPAPTYQSVVGDGKHGKEETKRYFDSDSAEETSGVEDRKVTENGEGAHSRPLREADDAPTVLPSKDHNDGLPPSPVYAKVNKCGQEDKNWSVKQSNGGTIAKAADDGPHDIPVERGHVVPSSRVLFRVMTTHAYVGEDTDELSFEIGEVITVVPFDDPEEEDDGWLMGIKESTREKGVFPENFTKRVDQSAE